MKILDRDAYRTHGDVKSGLWRWERGRSLDAPLKEAGVVGAEIKKIIKEMSEAAEAVSRFIWSMHQVEEWYSSE